MEKAVTVANCVGGMLVLPPKSQSEKESWREIWKGVLLFCNVLIYWAQVSHKKHLISWENCIDQHNISLGAVHQRLDGEAFYLFCLF